MSLRLASRFFILAAVVLLGAGCSKSSTTVPLKGFNPSGNDQAASSQIQGVPEHWSQIAVVMGTSTVRIAFPGTVNTMDGAATDQVVQTDMGTAVLDPKDLAVPTRSLRVFLLRPEDKRLKDCAFSENGWSGGASQNVQKKLKFGSFPYTFCQHSESNAAVGNRYAINSFSTQVNGQVLVLEFMVHSVACENYPKPKEQCVEYDEKRDTAIFPEILSQLKVD